MDIRFRVVPGAFLLMALILWGCATAPYTERQQLILVSQSEAVTLGTRAYGDILKTSRLSSNQTAVDMVRAVGSRIAGVADREFPDATKGFRWEFNVIEEDQPNAFALPGGKVAVYTGILKYTESRAGLATVIAHEIAHVIARHGSERMSRELLVQLGATGLSAALQNGSPVATQAVLSAFGIGATVGVLLPFSRTEESEADHIGLILMSKAGYDPRQALLFWQRMDKAEQKGQKPPAFLSTHPTDEQRIADIQRWLPEAMQHYGR